MTKEKLMSLGFEEKNLYGIDYLILVLNKGNDRHTHQLRWYENSPDYLLIDCYYMRGLETIEEEDLLRNHNGLSSNAVAHYLEIKEKLETLK